MKIKLKKPKNTMDPERKAQITAELIRATHAVLSDLSVNMLAMGGITSALFSIDDRLHNMTHDFYDALAETANDFAHRFTAYVDELNAKAAGKNKPEGN